jgi:hypothetical protein
MEDQFNPYAAPTATTMHPRAAEWLRSTSDPSLQKVARGLGLIYASIVLILLCAILAAVLGPVFAGVGGRNAMRAAQAGQPIDPAQAFSGVGIFLILCGLGIITGYIMSLVGSLMCLATPEETGAKGLITTSVAVMVIALVLNIATYAIDDARAENAIDGLSKILSVVGGITFILFLKKLAEFIGAHHLATRAKSILIALAVGVLLMILSIALIFSAGPRAGGGGVAVAGLIMLVVLIGGLVVFVMYANLINNLRKAIQSGGTTYS